jgi:hypothetical protein
MRYEGNLSMQRSIVIVDHFSEMSETTRRGIRPELPDFAANALIVTSRIEESLGQVTKTIIKPCRIESFTALSSFMETYLIQLGKHDLFSKSEFFYACGRFSAMVGIRGITILLSKLYVEQMIAIKENSVASDLPSNIPDLMFSYLNELNRNVIENKLDDRTIHRDAKVVAWECLRQAFRPTSACLDDTLAALDRDDALIRLKYLEDRLHLIQIVQPSQDRLRFLLDPLAEYLAGMHLVKVYNGNETAWREFLGQTESRPGPITSFLLAIRDCCLAKGEEMNIPTFVHQELERLSLQTFPIQR